MEIDIKLPNTLLLGDLESDSGLDGISSVPSVSDDMDYQRWNSWFSNQPSFTIPEVSDDPCLTSYLSSFQPINSDFAYYLKIQYHPSSNALLNSSQLQLLSILLDLIRTPNDAVALSYLLQDNFFCTLSTNHTDVIANLGFSSDFFRLLFLYYHPTLAFKYDRAYPGWEKMIVDLLIHPTLFLSALQLRGFVEQLQQSETHSIVWFMLYIIHSLSFQFSCDSSLPQIPFIVIHFSFILIVVLPSTFSLFSLSCPVYNSSIISIISSIFLTRYNCMIVFPVSS